MQNVAEAFSVFQKEAEACPLWKHKHGQNEMGPFCLKSLALLGSLTDSSCNYFFLLNAALFDGKQPAFDIAGNCEGFCV